MSYFFDNLKNNFDFFVRNHINLSRKNYCEKPKLINILRNIYFFNIFRKCFSKIEKDEISVLDIGSKNWEYFQSEYSFFNIQYKNLIINGIELDSNRLNLNMYNRYEIAKFYTKNIPNAKYISGDFLKHNQKYDYIIWILPFITKYPLIRWGLPLRYFKPEEMLSHAYNILNKNGELLIINQGSEEYKIQQKLNEKLKLPAQYFGKIDNKFNLFKNERYCSKITKTN